MRARYPVAVATRVDWESVELGLLDPPMNNRIHLFDYVDGLRMMIARLSFSKTVNPVVLHAMFRIDGTLYADLSSGKISRLDYLKLCLDRFQVLSGGLTMEFRGWVGTGIPFWQEVVAGETSVFSLGDIDFNSGEKNVE